MTRMKQRVGWVGLAFGGLTAVMLLMWATGLVMFALPVADLMDMSEQASMARRLSGVTHGVAAWCVCVLCGRGVWPHVQWIWRQRVERYQWAWGVLNLGALVLLALSGLALLYGSSELHEALSPVHVWIGVVAPIPWVIHAWRRWFRKH